MDLIINKDSSVLINEQIITQLRYQIINGELEKGSRLPSARKLASLLKVNRHTVSKAYKELENEGLIETKQSLGTYVSNKNHKIKDMDKFVCIIKEAMEVSNSLGFNSKEFLSMAEYVYLKESNKKRVRGLFVECNEIALKHYTLEISKKLDIDVDGCLLDDISEDGEIKFTDVNDYDLIMTTMAHYSQLNIKFNNHKNIYALNFSPFLKVLNRIIKLPKTSNIGIVCINEVGTLALKQILTDLGAVQGFIMQSSTNDLDKVREMSNKVDILIVSKYALEENSVFFSTLSKDIIEYTNVLHDSSVRMLQDIISQLMKLKLEELKD